jgi:branched-chain amino acid transport system substrate-binding protein
VNYEGASGNVDFDANGDVSPPFVRVEMKDGRLVETGEAK